ncbi:uncharacterized protein HMPREF1541_10874 [Cyphellophora europaea CBS 101466]|uniref:Glucose-methanol-choline oxidoreductase N-terminal domain-containing protein n=1 Tax=Cyphellophora europaea (strain CBS 101466) TaxID=1220924 RepID=W2S7W4_CYPE1|nr:uncharacterized protein HMPREF1541_10874 [Cyphellophora europaea CBS 101466]ETN44009.1 hypothetical protein HMPREF1541_10874 [Cyphellophora europaea CBS 101466]
MATSSSTIFCDLHDFLKYDFDYIIVGGGTAGLVVAARLTEDPTITVGVLEAGEARLDDPKILTPLLFPSLPGNQDYDWMMKTVSQAGTNNKIHAVPRGKVLGGSSAINFMLYVRGQSREYDDWARFGVDGWRWNDLKPFFDKHEGLVLPGEGDKVKPTPRFDVGLHGSKGPIRTSFADWQPAIEVSWHEALSIAFLGVDWDSPSDFWNGKHLGDHSNLSTIDRTKGSGTRSYAVTGYLSPIMKRGNLKILTGVCAETITLETGAACGPTATGVTFMAENGRIHVKAHREVLICAGAIKTPQILELSGIGNRAILENAGVRCVVESNDVGENLQDHLMTCMVYETKDEVPSLDVLTDDQHLKEAIDQYQTAKPGPLGNSVDAICFLPVAKVATKEEIELLKSANMRGEARVKGPSSEVRRVLSERLEDQDAAGLQLSFLGVSLDPSRMDDQTKFLAPASSGQSRVTVGVALCHPFSRGSVHIDTSDPSQPPRIDPAYLQDPVDLEVTSIGLRAADEVFRTSPLAEQIKGRVFPSQNIDLGDAENRASYIREHAGTQYHPIGTAALGSVVSDSLRVIGVDRLRVIDASILPLHISGNIQATVYAIAEKAADIIKESI